MNVGGTASSKLRNSLDVQTEDGLSESTACHLALTGGARTCTAIVSNVF